MGEFARAIARIPMKTDPSTGRRYEGKTVVTRTAHCSRHGVDTSTYCGVNRSESDGLERWVFFCKGTQAEGQDEGHYFAVRAPFDA